MRSSLLLASLLWTIAPAAGQTPPSVQFVGCSEQALSSSMSFQGSILRNTVTLSGARSGSPAPVNQTIYWSGGASQTVTAFPASLTFASSSSNYSLQIVANMADGTQRLYTGEGDV